MKTEYITPAKDILDNYPVGNVIEINEQFAIVSSVTRSQIIQLDRLLEISGIVIFPNDKNTLKIIL